MCKHCGHAYGDHWREANKCAVKDCPCPGYETSDEEKAVRLNRNSLWALAGMILTSPLFFFFVERGDAATGRAAWVCAGIFFIAAKMRWQFRSTAWFWITLTGLLALHVPLILYVPWTNGWIPAVAILPIGALDLAIILGSIALVQRMMTASPNPHEHVP